MRIYLNVPYSEKEEAKSLGARWNPTIKKWYINSTTDELPREFLKWECPIEGIPGILKDYIYVIEGQQKCWKCGKQTRVIGLGLGENIDILSLDEDEIDELPPEFVKKHINFTLYRAIHLAWIEKEEYIPPKLLKYLKKEYSVKTVYSKTLGEKSFSNLCEHCGMLQGNYFVFHEMESPLTISAHGEDARIDNEILNSDRQGYDKTHFSLYLPSGSVITDRYDLGDGYGGLIEMIDKTWAFGLDYEFEHGDITQSEYDKEVKDKNLLLKNLWNSIDLQYAEQYQKENNMTLAKERLSRIEGRDKFFKEHGQAGCCFEKARRKN